MKALQNKLSPALLVIILPDGATTEGAGEGRRRLCCFKTERMGREEAVVGFDRGHAITRCVAAAPSETAESLRYRLSLDFHCTAMPASVPVICGLSPGDTKENPHE
jgi:hypothetical protein